MTAQRLSGSATCASAGPSTPRSLCRSWLSAKRSVPIRTIFISAIPPRMRATCSSTMPSGLTPLFRLCSGRGCLPGPCRFLNAARTARGNRSGRMLTTMSLFSRLPTHSALRFPRRPSGFCSPPLTSLSAARRWRSARSALYPRGAISSVPSSPDA